MKKSYINPECTVFNIETVDVVAGSITFDNKAESGTEGTGVSEGDFSGGGHGDAGAYRSGLWN